MDSLFPHLSLLAEPVRVRLLALLSREELGVSELCRVVNAPQSTVSRHLKDLRVAGWLRRRTEGTSGLVRLDTSELPPEAVALWAVVRDAWMAGPQWAEDEGRLAAVIAAREASTSWFGRLRRDWERVRRDLFGEGYVAHVLVALLGEGAVIADLGCGTGEMLALLAPAASKVIGVDREQAMLDVAAERTVEFANVDLRRGTLDDLPLKNAEVDLAVCMLVLHHVEAPDRAFAEVRRVLRKEGRVVLLDMQKHDRSEYRATMGHVHLGFSEAEVRGLADDAGLRLLAWRPLGAAAGASGPPLFVAVLGR